MNDRNVLSVLIYLSQAFADNNGKFFRQRSKLMDDIKDSEFELSDRQITRCLVKLQHFGYIKYRAGFHNNSTGKGSASEFELCYSVDNQTEHQNNVYPNTNTNTNTNTNPNININTKAITSDISTYKGVDVLTHLLTKCKDELEVYNYLKEHPTQSNFDKVEQYWADDETRLAELHNFKRNLHYTATI